MVNVQIIMLELYDVLLRLKYPEITKAEPETLANTILSGQNRVSLLCWILAENSPGLDATLKKWNGTALEDEIAKIYLDIGICDNKEILLGKCKLEEQLPTLELLLEFIKTMQMDRLPEHGNGDDSIESLTTICLENSKSINSKPYNANYKINYSEAKEYFEDIKDNVNKSNLGNTSIMSSSDDQILPIKEDYKCIDDQEALYDMQTKKFIKTFESVSSWPTCDTTRTEDTTNMNLEIKDICTDFLALKQILQANCEISKTAVLNNVPQTSTPLNSVIENIVTDAEAVINLYKIDHID